MKENKAKIKLNRSEFVKTQLSSDKGRKRDEREAKTIGDSAV